MKIIGKQKLYFISLIGIILTSSMLLFSYAYQKVSVDYEESSGTGMTINVGKLDVSFTTTNRINMSNMSLSKDYKTSKYTEFTIDNTKSTSDVYYLIKLSNLEYDSALITEDFKYTLTEVVDNNESVVGSGDFKFLSGVEHKICFNKNRANYIVQGKTKKLRLYLWIKETNKNQNDLENTSFKGKIEINSYLNQDATKLNLSNLRIYGNSVQNGTPTVETPVEIVSLGESKNLFDPYTKSINNKGIKDGSIQDDGSYRIKPSLINFYYDNTTLPFENNSHEQYTLTLKTKMYSTGTGDYYRIGFRYTDGTYSYCESKYNTEYEIVTFTSSPGKTIQGIGFDYKGGGDTIWLDILYLQLEKGTVSTDYTPYHYIDIVNSGKNLFSENTITGHLKDPYTYIYASVPLTLDYYNKYLKEKDLTISCETITSDMQMALFIFGQRVDSTNTYYNSQYSPKGINYKTFTFSSDINFNIITAMEIRFWRSDGSNNETYTFSNVQLEEGTEATSYEPYQEPIKTTINLDGHDSLKKVGDIADYIDLGQGKIVRKIGVIESYNGEIISSEFISSTGSLTTGAKVYYVLDTEIIEDIDVSQFNNIKNKGIIDIDANISASKIEFSI